MFTIRLCDILESLDYDKERYNNSIFTFNYKFYNEEHKKEFEEQFINYFYFREIGFETMYMFKAKLKSLLNTKFRKYEQLFQSEQRCSSVDFMVNKDYVEEIDNTTTNTYSDVNKDINKNLDTPQSQISDLENNDYVSSANINDVNNTGESLNNSNIRTVGKGNIGITSSGTLLKKWRDTMINLDEMLLNECEQLFLKIYE